MKILAINSTFPGRLLWDKFCFKRFWSASIGCFVSTGYAVEVGLTLALELESTAEEIKQQLGMKQQLRRIKQG